MSQGFARKATGPDKVEAEFAETLRGAAFIFENDKNGRFQGSILACRAVAHFIYCRGGGAEVASPFLQIAEAFADLERGGNPRLFAKKTVLKKERERSPERRHIQMLAAAALEVLLQTKQKKAGTWSEESRTSIADRVARYVNKWLNMENQQLTGGTVIAWRNKQKQLNAEDRKPFDAVVEQVLSGPNPSKEIDRLLRSGPPGQFKD
jgi:hypothetical protein